MNTNYKYFIDWEAKASKENLSVTGNWRNSDADYIELLDESIENPLNGGVSQPYIISLVNTSLSNDWSNVVILNANSALVNAATNFGITNEITVSMGISSITYGEFLFQTITQPFQCCTIAITASRPRQLNMPLTIQHKDADGKLCQDPIIPLVNPYQSLTSIVVKEACFSIDGSAAISIFSVLANTTVSIYMFQNKKANMRNNLLGENTKTEFDKFTIIQPKQLTLNPKLNGK